MPFAITFRGEPRDDSPRKKVDDLQKVKDVRKVFEGEVNMRYLEVSCSGQGMKVSAKLLSAENGDHPAVLMTSCNRDGQGIAKKAIIKILSSLT